MKKYCGFILACILIFAVAGDAWAVEKKPRESLLGKMFAEKNAKDGEESLTAIPLGDKSIITQYISANYSKPCVSKFKTKPCKNEVKPKKYRVGERLSLGKFSAAPADLVSKLAPLPKGYKYARAEDDILLISSDERLVIDAVTVTPEKETTQAEQDKKSKKKSHTSKTLLNKGD